MENNQNTVYSVLGPQLVLIIPCYNEEKRLQPQPFLDYVTAHVDMEFLFVNDGSADGTKELLACFIQQHPRLHMLNLPRNNGKAEAVRQGILYVHETFRPEYVGFWDADLATPLSELGGFIDMMRNQVFDIVIGLRLMRLGAKVQRKTLRHIFGRIFATAASNILGVAVYDTQCGAKLFRAELTPILFCEKFISRWIFDVEILARYIKHFGRENATDKICEYPVRAWLDVDQSRLRIGDFIAAPRELWKIKRTYF